MSFNQTNIDLLCETQCGYDRNYRSQFVAPEQKFVHGMATEVPTTALFCATPLLFSPIAPYAKGYWQKITAQKHVDEKFSKINKIIREEQKTLKENKAFLSKDLETGKKYGFRTRMANKYKFNALNSFMSDVEKVTPQLTEINQTTRSSKPIPQEGKKAIETARDRYAKALRKINNIKNVKSTTLLNQEYREIIKLMQEGDLAINKAKMTGAIMPSSKFGKMAHAVNKGLGIYKAKGFMLKTSAGANALKGLKGFGKVGVGFAIVTETLGELPDLQGAKQIDKYERSQGRTSNRFQKQCGKSAVKVGCVVAGGVLGSMAAGAAVGAVCGTVVPVVGNIVGFVGGAIGGLIGGLVGSKIVGKSEVEKYQDEQQEKAKKEAEKLKKEAKKDGNVRDELLSSLEEARESGQLNDEKIKKALKAELEARGKELEEIEKKEMKRIEAENKKALESSIKTQDAYTAPTDAISWVKNTNTDLNLPISNYTPSNFNISDYNTQLSSIFSIPMHLPMQMPVQAPMLTSTLPAFDINPFSVNCMSAFNDSSFLPLNNFNEMNLMI